MRIVAVVASLLGAFLTACSTPTLFPPDLAREARPIEFGVLHAAPDVYKGRVVQLAGRIVEVQPSSGGWLIVAEELPVTERPVYGPRETNVGTPRFAIQYNGTVDEAGLWFGNKVMVLAVAQGNQPVLMDGAAHTAPYVVAQCMHVWKTGGYGYYGIADFPHTQDGYWPLDQQTYCTS